MFNYRISFNLLFDLTQIVYFLNFLFQNETSLYKSFDLSEQS